ncbi:hypothetical protein LOZ80_23540 [Paenibacillus sp. HWE-109]|uniref:glycosyl hydrolase family 95 catalytic domain-containing protein n=1 Tax=Paenibacillus sp. HWE-109 TaxID=1306526 RepID=UPI001EDDC088|nr:hypothetical protein [Paenibacillus sp. HWE-109]UKS24585.1 hypothetical protein LOZ80_23540 [Paenibacillus sp. HWE-109]
MNDCEWEPFMADNDMEWVVKPVSWDEGAFIGNGSIGAMVYGEEHAKKRHVLRFVLGRTDVTAARSDRPGFPPRVPIGELDVEMAGMIYHPTSLRVDLWQAELRAKLTTTRGEVNLRSIVHSVEPVIAIEMETSEGEEGTQVVWYAHSAVDDVLKNADGINLNQYVPETAVEQVERNGIQICVQRYSGADGCVVAWKEVQLARNRRVCFLSIINGQMEAAIVKAVEAVAQAAAADYDAWINVHRKWWHDYYRQSFVAIPDARLQSFYWIQMYKLASATRADQSLIDNQGPWLTSTPWPGVWFNMNVQMSYSPVYTANRLDLGMSLVHALDANRENLIANVPEAFRQDASGLGRSSSYDLRAEVEDEVGNLTWLCHNVWRQYRYSMDDEMLKNTLYPHLRRSVNLYLHLVEEGSDGLLHLPATISPEYGSFMRMRVSDCHYDLALLRWGCQTLLYICQRLQVDDPLIDRWKDILQRLVPFPVDESGFMVGRDTPLAYGHRHFSHLLAIFPLHLIGCEREEERELIAASLRHWIDKEGDLRGFSLTGAASIAAILGRGNEALRYLQALLLLIKPNTMYKEAGPVIETPLAGAEAIQDMLLQSWGGQIRVFPAVPDEWRDVSFEHLRAEGAFLISAVRRHGETQFIRVKSLAGEPCLIQTGWVGDVQWKISGTRASEQSIRLETKKEAIMLDLRAGDEAILFRGAELPETQIGPVKPLQKVVRYYGGNKPWRLYGF